MRPKKQDIGGALFWAYAIVPWIVSLVVNAFVTFGFSSAPKTVAFIIFVLAVTCGFLWNHRDRNAHFKPLAIAMSIATASALVFGLYNFDKNEVLATYYDYAREYTNVVPSEPAGGTSDAGVIDFTVEATVDITRSVGFTHKGIVYCIAPVFDRTSSAEVQYWATGIDCCRPMSDYWCDAAKDPLVHGGAVVFDNKGWFQSSNRDFYVKAMKKAMAEFGLQTAKHPIYLRWTASDNKWFLRNYYRKWAVLFFFGFLLAYGIVSCIIASVFIKNAPREHSMLSHSATNLPLYTPDV